MHKSKKLNLELLNNNIMFTITEKQYSEKHQDYKSIFSSDEWHGTNHNGKRTLLAWDNGTCLLIEGESLNIVKTEAENINPLKV